MCREQRSAIVFPTQCAHDLRDRQWRKNARALEAERQAIGEYFAPQSRGQTVTLARPRAHRDDRWPPLPAACTHMVWLPKGPSLRSSPRPWTQGQQRRAARCACAQAAEAQRPTGGALTPQAARRDGHPPWGRWHDDGFFPGRRLVFLPVPRKDRRPLARPHEVANPSLRQTLSACLRHPPPHLRQIFPLPFSRIPLKIKRLVHFTR
jgi:hypothetical protein